jgi:RNA polymerase sigma-70 factor (ECF subfamily)
MARGQGLRGDSSKASRDGEADDDLLLQGIANAEEHAFRRLMERHTRPLLALATRVIGNGADAEDVVQETFLKVWAMAPRWRADSTARFSTWAYRVVLNASLDVRRRRRFGPLEEAEHQADTQADGLDRAVARQREVMVQESMAELPHRQRAALSLHYFGEISAPEAAQILGLTGSAMEALLVRGKRRLKMELTRRGVTGLGDVT